MYYRSYFLGKTENWYLIYRKRTFSISRNTVVSDNLVFLAICIICKCTHACTCTHTYTHTYM